MNSRIQIEAAERAGVVAEEEAAVAEGGSGPDDGFHDSLSNRLEYAFDQNPGLPNTAALATGSIQEFTVAGRTGRYLTITFSRRTDILDLTWTPQFSSNLTAWTPATVLVTSTPGSGNS